MRVYFLKNTVLAIRKKRQYKYFLHRFQKKNRIFIKNKKKKKLLYSLKYFLKERERNILEFYSISVSNFRYNKFTLSIKLILILYKIYFFFV